MLGKGETVRRVNIIFICAVLGSTIAMYINAYVGMALESNIGIFLAVSACYLAMAGLLLSIGALLIGTISIVSRIRKSTGLILPLLNIVLGMAFILLVFVLPIINSARQRAEIESQQEQNDQLQHKPQP